MSGFFERLDQWTRELEQRHRVEQSARIGGYADPLGRWYHGTHPAHAQSILSEGFKVQMRHGWTQGAGVYFSEFDFAKRYGSAVIEARIHAAVHVWDDPSCVAVRQQCGYLPECRASLETSIKHQFYMGGHPEAPEQLTAAMLEAGVQAVWFPASPLFNIGELVVYDVNVIEVVGMTTHTGWTRYGLEEKLSAFTNRMNERTARMNAYTARMDARTAGSRARIEKYLEDRRKQRR